VRNLEVDCEGFVDFGAITGLIDAFDHVLLVPKKHLSYWQKIEDILEPIGVRVPVIVLNDSSTVEDISVMLGNMLEAVTHVSAVRFTLYEGPKNGVKYPPE